MKNTIVFSSKLRTNDTIRNLMATKAKVSQVTVIDLEKTPDPDLSDQDIIIIGSELIYNKLSWLGEVAEKLTTRRQIT